MSTSTQARLSIVPVTLRVANAFVAGYHRHHKPTRGHKFSIGVVDEAGDLRGVAIVGRPVSRHLDDGFTAEVNRTCTDGCDNANSALYAAAWRAARAMGYRRLITYTQSGESGVSLTAAGWLVLAERPARPSWRESSVKYAALRDPIGTGGVARTLWAAS